MTEDAAQCVEAKMSFNSTTYFLMQKVEKAIGKTLSCYVENAIEKKGTELFQKYRGKIENELWTVSFFPKTHGTFLSCFLESTELCYQLGKSSKE